MDRMAALASSVVASTPTVLPFSRPRSANTASTHRKTFRCVFHIDQPPRSRDRRVIGGFLIQTYAQKLTQTQRVGYSPRDATFRLDPLEVPNQQQAEIGSGRQRWPSISLSVELGTLGFGELIELLPVEQIIHALIERMAGCGSQFGVHDPKMFLPPPAFPCAHRHTNILRRRCLRHQGKARF